MDIEKQIKADAAKMLEKLAKIKKWDKRMKKLKTRKNKPKTETTFCDEHEINVFRFNRFKNMREKKMPSDAYIKSIEDAFEAEGV